MGLIGRLGIVKNILVSVVLLTILERQNDARSPVINACINNIFSSLNTDLYCQVNKESQFF
jgi:hypothetical protein